MMMIVLRWVGGATMALALLGYVYHLGGESARGECTAAAIQRKLEIAQADLKEIQKKHDEADQRAKQLAGRAQSNEEKADALARDLDEARLRPDPVAPPAPAPIILKGECPAPPPAPARAPYRDPGLSDGDVGRLRGIRGR